MSTSPLPPECLTPGVETDQCAFLTTVELAPWEGPLGHRRAIEAIELAIAMQGEGYNVFVMGEPGTGRMSLLRKRLGQSAQTQSTPGDWLYLNRFDELREPATLCLDAGCGRKFAADIETFIDTVLVSASSAYENPAYQQRRTRLTRSVKDRCDAALDRAAEEARAVGIALLREGETVTLAPIKDGRPVDESALSQLTEAEREHFQTHSRTLEDTLGEALLELPQWRRELDQQLHRLAGEAAADAINGPFTTLTETYAGFEAVMCYLKDMRADLAQILTAQLLEERGREAAQEPGGRDWLRRRYGPRILVSRSPNCGAPVVYEPNPTLQNLFGRIEYVSEQGALVTDHHLIYPGALHQANGGYLILEAVKVLVDPAVWSALKRALKCRSIQLEAPTVEQGAPTVSTLNPAVIPLSVKVALVGSQDLFYELRVLDDEFPELFRVLAEFEQYFPRNTVFKDDFARLLKTLAEVEGLTPLTAAAMSFLFDFSSRLVGHRKRLSAQVGRVLELAREADLFRSREGSEHIEASHVRAALTAKRDRMGREAEYALRDILDGVVLIATEGVALGKANALTVAEIGDTRIGLPARVTATVYPGGRGVVDIEREVDLGQAIHSKGVMILAGYLGQKYARRFPLAISANLALEQSYGYVDGDSAALAELCALISALTGIPLRQTFAVTGSINQYGDVQAVGGVNEKIEGFFELCAARSLNGSQGVIIPWANRDNLVLREELVEAARAGMFAVHAVGTVDQTLELLTGKPAAVINDLALARLEKYANLSKRQTHA